MVCESCEGTGVVRDNQNSNGEYQFGKVKCEACSGTGNYPTKITKEDLKQEAILVHTFECETDGCIYTLDSAPMIELIFQISVDGGSFSFCTDDNGKINGWKSECPLCHKDTITLSS